MNAAAPLEHRTVDLELEEPYEGWRFTIRVDYPARVLVDLASGNALQAIGAMDTLVTEHNFPDSAGNVAASMLDVDPMGAVLEAIAVYMKHRTSVPNPSGRP